MIGDAPYICSFSQPLLEWQFVRRKACGETRAMLESYRVIECFPERPFNQGYHSAGGIRSATMVLAKDVSSSQ